MNEDVTKEQLIDELRRLRSRLDELESVRSVVNETVLQNAQCYQELFEESKDAIYISSREGKILSINRAGVELFGYTREEITGMDIRMLYADPLDREKFRREIEPSGAVKDYGVLLVKKDGTKLQCLLTSTVRRSPEGTVMGYQGIIRDITCQKLAEEEIRKLNSELQRRITDLQQANRDLDSFIYSVSHDLRSPLTIIGGFAERILKNGVLDAASRDNVRIIRTTAGKMEDLIDDLLSFSRLGRKQMKLVRVDMENLVRSVFEELRTSDTGREILFRTGNLMPVYADEGLIRQVIINLLSNAFKFTRQTKKAEIEIGSEVEEDEIHYWVRDNGVGFEMPEPGRLFEVFYRGHSSEEFEGTGIGLAIVHRIITRHGGRVRAEGTKGAGATFYFTLPRKE